ncbi:MAG: extracellular solute-binding protein [Planctomycetes bacterium]|nr:extracellular solute-binding protein [Planctomycetota bacterium]
MKSVRHTLLLVAILAAALVFQSCGGESPSEDTSSPEGQIEGKLIIFHAGSLSVPFRDIAKEFQTEYPDVNVVREAAGSRRCARKVSDLGRECGVLASSDYTVIDTLLIPEYASWNIKFASNEMTLVHREDSSGADELTAENWYEILLRDDVAFGRSDPNADPCGYRAVLTMKLAEKHYGEQGLAKKMLAKDTRYIRPKETDLLALLESEEIDYIFLYRSVAQQHELPHLLLPDEINLKKPELTSLYKSVSVELSGKEPGSTIVKKGQPMVYGVTIPENAPNRPAALAFVEFLLQEDSGMAIMEKNGQPSVVPSPSATCDKIPDCLKQFAKEPAGE